MGAERRGVHRAYQANTQTRRALSFFVLACAIIRKGDLSDLSREDFAMSLASIPRVASA
jgi:hypothetical protein